MKYKQIQPVKITKRVNYGVSIGQIVLIILGLIGLILAVKFFVDILPDIKPQFTIYKEECITENYTLSLMASGEKELLKFMIERNITRCLKKEIVTPKEGFFKGITFYFCDYNISYEQICEKVEVDEIKYDFYNNQNAPDEYKVFNCPEHYSCRCNNENIVGSEPCTTFCSNNLCTLAFITLPKKDLTKKWLDENCLVGVNCDLTPEHNCEKFINKKDVWSEVIMEGRYKCFENYFVSVK